MTDPKVWGSNPTGYANFSKHQAHTKLEQELFEGRISLFLPSRNWCRTFGTSGHAPLTESASWHDPHAWPVLYSAKNVWCSWPNTTSQTKACSTIPRDEMVQNSTLLTSCMPRRTKRGAHNWWKCVQSDWTKTEIRPQSQRWISEFHNFRKIAIHLRPQ